MSCAQKSSEYLRFPASPFMLFSYLAGIFIALYIDSRCRIYRHYPNQTNLYCSHLLCNAAYCDHQTELERKAASFRMKYAEQ